MIDTVMFSSPLMWVLVAVVSLLHVACAVLSALGISKSVLNYVFIGINALSHIALFTVALILGAGAEEIFLAVMISAATGMLSLVISEKVAAGRTAVQEVGEEKKDGI